MEFVSLELETLINVLDKLDANKKALWGKMSAQQMVEHLTEMIQMSELKHEELELAIDDFIDNWLSFEEYYEEYPTNTNLHPYYGKLNEENWRKLHSKHFTHHFQQFGLI